jgi:hypothetical protein
VNVRGLAQRERVDGRRLAEFDVDLGVLVGFGLVDAHLQSVVPVFRSSLDTEDIALVEFPVVDGRGLLVPERERDGAGLVGRLDVDHLTLLGLVVVALKGA